MLAPPRNRPQYDIILQSSLLTILPLREVVTPLAVLVTRIIAKTDFPQCVPGAVTGAANAARTWPRMLQ
jgi:hypothetical protein